MVNKAKKYELKTPDGVISYSRKSSFLKRLKQEAESWSWLLKVYEGNQNHHIITLRDYMRFRKMFSIFENLEEYAKTSTEGVNITIDKFGDQYGEILPLSSSLLGSHIIRSYEKGSTETAIMVLCGAMFKRGVERNTRQQIDQNAHGLVASCITAAVAVEIMEDIGLPNRLKEEADATLVDIRNEIDDASKLITAKELELASLSRTAEGVFEKIRKTEGRKIALSSKLFQRAIRGNDALQKLFLEQMRYRAPVQLWEERFKEHIGNSQRAIWVFYLGAVLYSACLISIVYFNFSRISALLNDYSSPSVVLLITVSTLITSFVLWVLRYQMKVHLSERHLARDAQERKAFAETFLALREDKSVSGDQEAIVMQSLFRPTQDGIIKDDTNIDLTPTGLFSKLLSGKN